MPRTELFEAIRAWEIDRIAGQFEPRAHVLEIGAGTGQQAAALAARGFSVAAIELADSIYSGMRTFPITDYDGKTLPFADQTFDVVFSSNVLEHVKDLAGMHAEIRRVLKPDGCAIHVLPTHAWRTWTTLSSMAVAVENVGGMMYELVPRRGHLFAELRRLASTGRKLLRCASYPFAQSRHGERGNLLSEAWYFRPAWWRREFAAHGFFVEFDSPMGLFYTGNLVMGRKWDIGKRARLAPILGSACHLFRLRLGAAGAKGHHP